MLNLPFGGTAFHMRGKVGTFLAAEPPGMKSPCQLGIVRRKLLSKSEAFGQSKLEGHRPLQGAQLARTL